MRFSWTRIGAISHKEFRDYRRNRFVIFTMAFLPLVFVTAPMIQLLTIRASISSAKLDTRIGISLLYMLIIPAVVPSTLAAYSVIGEREQGTLEPVLITPIRPEEFLVGKALAALVPTLVIAYTVFGVFLAATALFAYPGVASAVFDRSHLLVQLLFTPLLAGWSIWVGIAISARSADVRVAQQLGVFASLPPLAIVALMSFNEITPSVPLALGLAVALLVVDGLGWRAVAAMFDRERLVTGARKRASHERESPEARTDNRSGERGERTMSATLKLTREAFGWELRRGTFDISVDGRKIGSLERHQTVEVPVDPGHHTLRILAGRYSSRDHSFDAADGETINFRLHGATLWPLYVASIVKPDLAISIKRQ